MPVSNLAELNALAERVKSAFMGGVRSIGGRDILGG